MTKKGHKAKSEKEIVEKEQQQNNNKKDVDEEEINSGFGNYLRSSTGNALKSHLHDNHVL
jgi:hypothetical protein